MKMDAVMHVRYHGWATELLLEAAGRLSGEQLHKDLGTAYGSVFGTLVHIYLADQIWFKRFHGESPSSLPAVTAEEGLERLRMVWMELLHGYEAWSGGRSDEDWDGMLSFKDRLGNPYTMPLGKLLLHVVNHGTLHRGQVMAMFRQLGEKPPATDLLYYFRDHS